MEKNLTLLNRLVKSSIINPSLYYSINITEIKVQLQGHYNSDEICRLKTKHIKWEYDVSSPSGFFEMRWKLANGITVELTFT